MVRKHILPNGLRILLIPMRETATVTVGVFVGIGSRDEGAKENGISHFLEHMCFKGTTRRPRALDITRELDGLGSQFNAFTSHEYTGYYAKSHYEHLPELVDVVSDIYLHSTFPEAEMNKEKGVVYEEINMYNDQLDHVADKVWREALYKGSPLGRTIIGTPETLGSINRNKLKSYHQSHYNANNTVVVISGHFKEEYGLELVRSCFEASQSGEPIERALPKLQSKKPLLVCTYRKSEQAHIVLGLPAYSTFHPNKYALAVLSGILGGGMSSRLFQRVREEMGAAYYVYSSAHFATDCGDFSISAGVDKKRVKEILGVFVEELRRLMDENVDDEELERVKEYIIGNTYLSLETTDAFNHYFGIQEVMRRPIETPEEREAKIRAVTAKDIRTVALDILKGKALTASIVSSHKSIPGFNERDLIL